MRSLVFDVLALALVVATVAWLALTNITMVDGPAGLEWSWYGRVIDLHTPWVWPLIKWQGAVAFGLEVVPLWWVWENRKRWWGWVRAATIRHG